MPLPPPEFERWCIAPIAALIDKLRAKAAHVPIIVFPRGAGTQLTQFAGLPEIAAVGLDTATDPRAAAAALPDRVALQGNLDPLALVAGGAALNEAIERVLGGFESRAHIFNLGHGVRPETPVEHVEQLVRRVRA